MQNTSSAYEMGYQAGHLIGALVGALIVLAIPAAFILSIIMLIISKKKGWLFLLIPSGLAGLGLIVLLGIGVVAGVKAAKTNQVAHVVKSNDSLIEISAPGHWRTLEKINDEAQLQLGAPGREEYMLVFNEARSDFRGGLDEYGKLIVGHLQKALSDAVVSPGEKTTVNGLNAIQYTLSGTIKGLNVDYLVTVVESKKYFHQVVTWTLHSKKDKAFPVFRETTGTFKVDEVEAAK